MTNNAPLFHRPLLQLRAQHTDLHSDDAGFFIKHVSGLLRERLEDITRSFAQCALLGGYQGLVQNALEGTPQLAALEVIELGTDEIITLAPQSMDAVVSAWGIHWINDLPGVLTQIRHALKPDGCFVALLPGPKTLQELRESFSRAAAAHNLPLHNHIAPFAEVRDVGNLLQRAGFTLPVVDTELLTLSYPNPMKLLRELQAMGETNALTSQSKGVLPRAYFPAMAASYAEKYADSEGRVPATVEIISLTAWAPHASQPQPAKRGSGTVSFIDALKD